MIRLILTSMALLIMASPALAQQTAATADRWWGIPPLIWAAIVGALAALATSAIKDFAWPAFREHRDRQADQERVLRNYIAPLATATDKCIWRFSELFVDNRHSFLRSAALPLGYNDYKRTSTLYRLASVLGWMRAIEIELSSLKKPNPNSSDTIIAKLAKVRSAFAEGHKVEDLRLAGLLRLWNLPPPTDEVRNKLAADLEVTLFDLAGDKLEGSSRGLPALARSDQLDVVYGLATFLCSRLGISQLLPSQVEETQHQAIAAITFREALIYRDWQDAIGDEMLEPDTLSERRYRVVGYEKFCNLLASDKPWFRVLRESIVDIDFDQRNPNDFRAKQLRDLAVGIAEVYQSIGHSMKDMVVPATVAAAKRVQEACQKS